MLFSTPDFKGEFVALTILDPDADTADLFAISSAPEVAEPLWRFMPCGPFGEAGAMRDFWKNWQSREDVRAFVVRDANNGAALGSISLMSIRPEHKGAELGNIWYAPAARRTKVNTEANYLLLQYCFETLGYRRMEWKCDARNQPSRQAALRLGYRFEGIFRQHMIVKGENRDTAWFSLLDSEWPATGRAMAHWLYKDDSKSLGTLILEGAD